MKTIDPADIVAALSHCDPDQLAAALAATRGPAFENMSQAVLAAAERRATYPRADVIAEADALLYDVLRWPIADANHAHVTLDPTDFARHRGTTLAEAQRTLQHVTATESVAVDQLIASGIEPNFTLEQAQVYDCITTLRAQQTVPTRHLVREHATAVAVAAMRPDDGTQPLVHSPDGSLPPRIVSPSPKVHALLWLDRMEADAPSPGLIEERIGYLQAAKADMGAASRQEAELRTEPKLTRREPLAAPEFTASLRLAG